MNINVNAEMLYRIITAIKAQEKAGCCQTPLLPKEVADDLVQHLGAQEAQKIAFSLVDKAKEEAADQLRIKETGRGRTAKVRRTAIALGRQQMMYLLPTAVQEIETVNEQLRAELPHEFALYRLSFVLQLALQLAPIAQEEVR